MILLKLSMHLYFRERSCIKSTHLVMSTLVELQKGEDVENTGLPLFFTALQSQIC